MTQQQQSPCVGICKLNSAKTLCAGCFRQPFEIKRWWSLSDEQRENILEDLPLRKQLYGGA